MNKKELIKHIEDLPYNEGLIVDTIKISRNGLLKLIEQLDEPGKVKIPQIIAEYIEQKKDDDYHLLGAMDTIMTSRKINLYEWFYDDDNMETFARAWIDGYEVEKEKRYTVTVKGDIKENMLVYGKTVKRYFFTKDYALYNVIYSNTQPKPASSSSLRVCE